MSKETICQTKDYLAVVSSITGRTIYVNTSLTQFLVSPMADQVAVAKVAKEWLERMAVLIAEHRPPPRMRLAVEDLQDCSKSLAKTIDNILGAEYRDRLQSSAVKTYQRYLVELMLALWSIGTVAWPVVEQSPFSNPFLNADNKGFIGPQRSWLANLRDYLNRGGTDDSNNFRFILDALLSRAGVVELGDLTPESFQLSLATTRTKKLRGTGMGGVLHCLRQAYPDRNIAWTLEDFGFNKNKMGVLARDDEFQWALDKDPKLADWAILARGHVEQNPTNWKKRKSTMNLFMEYLLDNPDLPRNPRDYFDNKNRPKTLFDVPGNKGRQVMTIVHCFLDEALAKTCTLPDDNECPVLMPGYASPLAKPIYRGVNKGETHREAMPTRLIKQAMEILTHDDFAWPKEIGRVSDCLRWQNQETGQFESVWSPIRTYALMVKLLLPARTHQVRHLDSGEGDASRYGGDGTWSRNDGQHRPLAGQQVEAGVFRKYRRKDGTAGAVLFFNTNKTADADSQSKGYVMPWEKADVLSLLTDLRDWQEKYNSVSAPTKWTDIIELKAIKHEDDLAKMGESFFLFRDPCHRQRADLPVTDVRVRNLWLKLMEELERRLEASGEKLPNGDPIKLIATKDKYGAASSAVFDLHSLRVTLITAMYEQGVPPEMLMKIVGHATVVMTLYYTKIGAEVLTARMDEALLKRQQTAQQEWTGFLQRASREELETAVACTSHSALNALSEGDGLSLVVMDHGLCPVGGRRCHEGLAVDDAATGVTKHQPVPGGAGNCVRCRFFVSGPAFLLGLEAHVGELAYRLRKASYGFEQAQTRLDDLSDEFALALEEGTPFHKKRELQIAETAFEKATADVDVVAMSLQAAYALTEQSISIANRETGDGVSLVAVGGVDQVEAVLTETHEFEQLHRVCTSATFFDGLSIDWRRPNLERARLFDRVLRTSGRDAHFSLLSDEDALKAANAMGSFLYSRLDRDTVHDLIDGRTTLNALGMDKPFIDQIEAMTPKSISQTFTKLLEAQ